MSQCSMDYIWMAEKQVSRWIDGQKQTFSSLFLWIVMVDAD